ncbi:MAG: hypothetical protein WDN27_01240 [Candidatus Saccharibacteria bacterium]
MAYRAGVKKPRKSWFKRVAWAVGILLLVLVLATVGIWRFYEQNLKPLRGLFADAATASYPAGWTIAAQTVDSHGDVIAAGYVAQTTAAPPEH